MTSSISTSTTSKPTAFFRSRISCDYRHYADDYVRPHLGHRRVRDILPEVVLAWQRKILKEGGVGKNGKPLAAKTVRHRLARLR